MKKNFNKHPIIYTFIVVFIILLFLTATDIISNHFSNNYSELNTADQKILSEFNAYLKFNTQSEI